MGDHDGQDDRSNSNNINNRSSQLYLCNSLVFVIGSLFYVAMGCLPYSGLYYNKNNNKYNNTNVTTTIVTTTIVTVSDHNSDNSINDIDCDNNDEKYEEIVY